MDAMDRMDGQTMSRNIHQLCGEYFTAVLSIEPRLMRVRSFLPISTRALWKIKKHMRQNSSQQIRSNRSDQKSGGSTVPGLTKQEYPPTNYLQRWVKRKKEGGRVGLYKEIRKGWGQSQVSEGREATLALLFEEI